MGPNAQASLRELSEAERAHLAVLVRATSERADVRQRAIAVLAVAEGQSYEAAARRAGYAEGYTVSRLVQRANQRGLAALAIASGRGRKPTYSAADRQQILDTLQEAPARTSDQSATWSVTLLQRRLRAHGLPQVSRDTAHRTLQHAGATARPSCSPCSAPPRARCAPKACPVCPTPCCIPGCRASCSRCWPASQS